MENRENISYKIYVELEKLMSKETKGLFEEPNLEP